METPLVLAALCALLPVAVALMETPLILVALCALLPVLAVALIVGIPAMMRERRYGIGDFCVMVWLAGLVVGLAAKFLPVGASPLAVGLVSATAGLYALFACLGGIRQAGERGVESFAMRSWLQLRMLLLVAAIPWVPTGLVLALLEFRAGATLSGAALSGSVLLAACWAVRAFRAVAREKRSARRPPNSTGRPDEREPGPEDPA